MSATLETATTTRRETIEGFLSWSEGDLWGCAIKNGRYVDHEPNSLYIEHLVEDICISYACGDEDERVYPSKVNRQIMGGLVAAKRLCGKPRIGDQSIYYFKVHVVIDLEELTDWGFKILSFVGDDALKLEVEA